MRIPRNTLFALPLILVASLAGGAIGPQHPEPDKQEASVRSPGPSGGLDIAAWEGHRLSPLSNWPPAETDPAVDVLHYDLAVTFGVADTTLNGTATLTLVWGSQPNNVLHLDLIGLAASAVRDGGGSPLAYAQNGSGIDITVVPAPVRGDTVAVAVDYGGHTFQQGFYVFLNASYTFTEPEDSRYWFPCRDVPWDKATLTMHGRCASIYKLVSNGVLDSTTVDGAWTTYHWHESHRLATYLMAAAISNYTPVAAASTVTPLTWYSYPGDATAAANTFKYVPNMVAFFDTLLAPYPFDKYSMCESNLGGGMEHQTCTLMASFVFTSGHTYEWVAAHELAHQWFGDYVTLADWRHIWLNEGFATFYEAVWQESFYGAATFDARMLNAQNLVFNAENTGHDHPIVDPPINSEFSNIVYYKGAWVLRMLRDLLGRDTYNQAIRDYLAAHAYGNADTDDLRTAMEARYGQSLQWYFDQWLLGTGHPRINYYANYYPNANGYDAFVDLRQVQTGTVFRFPLEIRFTGGGGADTTVTGWVSDVHEVLHFALGFQPGALVLDPSNKLLDSHTETVPTGVAEVAPPPNPVRAWPNPFASRLHLSAAPGALGRVEIYDVQGRLVRTLRPAGAADAAWDGTGDDGRRLPPGAYFLRAPSAGRAVRVVLLPSGS